MPTESRRVNLALQRAYRVRPFFFNLARSLIFIAQTAWPGAWRSGGGARILVAFTTLTKSGTYRLKSVPRKGLRPTGVEPPSHCEIGSAPAQGNNCLIRSIVQLALPDLSWRGGEQAASGIRHQLAKEKRCPKHAYLELEKWRRRILRELGKNPPDYRFSRYTKASGAQFHGSGHINMVLFNEGFSLFVPVRHGGAGAGDGSVRT